MHITLYGYAYTDFEKKFVFIPDTVQSDYVPFVYDPETVCESGDIVCDGTEYYLPKPLTIL